MTSREVHWFGMRLAVPETWDLISHAGGSSDGQLRFIDRRDLRLEWSWRSCPREPDMDRMISDCEARARERDDSARFERGRRAGWRWLRIEGTRSATRAVRWERGSGRLIEALVPWPDGVCDEAAEACVLDGGRSQSGGGRQRWCAYEIDVTIPAGWTLEKAQVRPGEASLIFGRAGSCAVVRRLGAADAWFDGNLEAVLRRVPAGPGFEISAGAGGRFPTALGTGREAGSRWRGIVGLLRQRWDVAWFEPEANAVFHVFLLAKPREAARLDDFRVLRTVGEVAA